ncbi:CgeB family protein [Propionivibrio soli]|uniref:CgeB family protein n=1 Tax=Propionivibrio soli TaxID=2976531 RepID=UPI0021E742CF
MTRNKKIFVLDGIAGVPLGREITAAFQEIGVEAVHFDCLRQKTRSLYGVRSACAKAANKRTDRDGFYFLPRLIENDLNDRLEGEQPSDILVVGFAYKFFSPQFLKQAAARCGARLFLYDTDSCNLYSRRREFIFFVENELPIYDRVFSFSQVTTRFFRDTRGLDAVHLPFGANPVQLPTSESTIEALFVGSGDLRRIFLLERIREHVSIYGNRWERHRALISQPLQARIVDIPVWGETLHKLLASSRIILNITRSDFFGAETGINLRIFEALGAGRMLLTDYCEEIEDLFEIGTDIDVFRSSRELAEKVEYYLHNDDARDRIARNGQEKFLRQHTWASRIRQLSTHLWRDCESCA